MKEKLKVYLAGGISDIPRKNYQKEIANKIRSLGYEVYAASENDSINDKSNDPTPLDIYKGDIEKIKEADIFVVCISGGNEDGTLSEIGMVAGWNEAMQKVNRLATLFKKQTGFTLSNTQTDNNSIKIVAYTTNERLMEPQFWHGIASGGFNHLIAGMIDKWGEFVGGENEMFKYMEDNIRE